LNDEGAVLRQAWRESGFWRPGPGPDDIEVVLASNTGQALVFTGAAGHLRLASRRRWLIRAPKTNQFRR
jgi:hypothetical protein